MHILFAHVEIFQPSIPPRALQMKYQSFHIQKRSGNIYMQLNERFLIIFLKF